MEQATAMTSENSATRKKSAGRRNLSVGMSSLPMEWMDPMSWRLPSGKALAEFALQSGFLAPLILSGPRVKKRAARPEAGKTLVVDKGGEKAPGSPGSFPESK